MPLCFLHHFDPREQWQSIYIYQAGGLLGLNAAKSYCSESQIHVISSWRVIATRKDSMGRFRADFMASSKFLSLFSKYAIA